MAEQQHEDGSMTLELDLDEDQDQQQQQQPPEKNLAEGGEANADHHDDDDDDDDDGRQVQRAEGESHEQGTLSERTEQNRQRRMQRKQARKEREEAARRELESLRSANAQLNERLATIERRSTGAELATLDKNIQDTAAEHNYYRDQLALAANSNDPNRGAIIAEATDKMYVARQRFEHLKRVREAYTQNQQQPAALDPAVKQQAEAWQSRNSWFNVKGSDQDSQVARTIDNQMVTEGWMPNTKEYWDELDSRLKKYLPHRYNSSYNQQQETGGGQRQSQQQQQRSPVPSSSGREGGPSNGKRESYTISAARVQALKDAGVWDDPKKRADAIKRYREYDRQAQSNN